MHMFHSAFLVLFLALSGAAPAFSADSTTIAGRDVSSQDTIPAGFVAVWPIDAAIPKGWLPCDGQAVPADCPTLRGLMSRVPNYNTQRQFLRGATSGAGTLVADSVRSHAHEMDQHSHTVSGSSGAHSYSAPASGSGGGTTYLYPNIHYYTDEDSDPFYSWGAGHTTSSLPKLALDPDGNPYEPNWDIYGTVHGIPIGTSGTVQGTTSGGSISGFTSNSGPTSTKAAGGAETAPAHTLVKYIIKAH